MFTFAFGDAGRQSPSRVIVDNSKFLATTNALRISRPLGDTRYNPVGLKIPIACETQRARITKANWKYARNALRIYAADRSTQRRKRADLRREEGKEKEVETRAFVGTSLRHPVTVWSLKWHKWCFKNIKQNMNPSRNNIAPRCCRDVRDAFLQSLYSIIYSFKHRVIANKNIILSLMKELYVNCIKQHIT